MRKIKAATLSIIVASYAVTIHAEPRFMQGGTAGFVVSDIKYALGPDASETGACPDGMTKNASEIYIAERKVVQAQGESDEAFTKRVDQGSKPYLQTSDGENFCSFPELAEPDPHFKTIQRSDIKVRGINIDGRASLNDFLDAQGNRGIDNQFFRVVGCSRSFQSEGLSNHFVTTMKTGAWGITIQLSGLDDIKNDNEVEVVIAANADPIQLSAARDALPYATYARSQDPRFRAETTARIVDGVLTSDPVDMRFHKVVNSMILERPLQQARVVATLSEDGVLSGYLAGYTLVEQLYDLVYGYRSGKTSGGDPSPLRERSANGTAYVLGHTCNGGYYALKEHADAFPDPETGLFTAVSTQYEFSAIPAFIVDIETKSVNSELTPGRLL
jgi:hypothetical protein